MSFLDNLIQAVKVKVGASDAGPTNPLDVRPGGDLASLAVTTLSAKNTSQTYTLTVATPRWIQCWNRSEQMPVLVTIASQQYRIEPGGVRSFRVSGLTTMAYQTEVGNAQVEVSHSVEAFHQTTPTPPDERIEIRRTPAGIILAVKGWWVFRYDQPGTDVTRTTSFSTDGGATWGTPYNWLTRYPETAYITNAGTILVIVLVANNANAAELWRSADSGATFTKITPTEGGVPVSQHMEWYGATGIRQVRGRGIGGQATTVFPIIWGEYGATTDTHRVFRSLDDGVSFARVYDADTGAGGPSYAGLIRHFHNVDYDPSQYAWIVTSGDSDAHIHWLKSIDDGATWTEIVGATGSQKYRSVGMDFDSQGRCYWFSDSPLCGQGIYAATLAAVASPTMLMHSQVIGYGLKIYGNVIIACGVLHPDNPDRDNGGLFLSRDLGLTWRRLGIWHPDVGTWHDTGFHRLMGPDAQGYFYVSARSLSALGNPDQVHGFKFRVG